MHTNVKDLITGQCFRATFIYAFNKIEERTSLWQALIRLNVSGPWIVLGDFNNVMYANERLGQMVKDDEMAPFQSTVNTCDLHDMKSTGAFFTWNNKQPSVTRVFSRINRVLVNRAWLNWNTDWNAHYHPKGDFDHCPCIRFCGESFVGKKKSFKFFNMWVKVEDFGKVVAETWKNLIYGSPLFRVARKLKELKPRLKELNRSLFSDIQRNADVAYHLMIDCQLKLQADPSNPILMDKERQVRDSYHMLDVARTDFLMQKAKCSWAKEGDTNSSMFHQAIKHRQMHNKVLQIENSAGELCKEPEAILQAFVEYYKELLGTSAQSSDSYSHVVTQGCTLDVAD
ncbi:uncharacterized protein LOC141601868 [Silene latifolia]|uniref:uncharacterized protein LOC141601868 n=1 Tax=Silene latifolia TaxID=37657 RepID=UPI003D770B3A